MPTTTPNFGWSVPVSTDLVKDGATAIELLGDSIDTSLVDLLGGTTGQVLAKASGTDMDFSWVTTDDADAIQNAIVDAKGDLISATAADTPARLAVGANGTVLTADSAEATGLKWATPAGGGGKVLQVVNASTNTAVTVSNNTFTDTTLTATITPSAATSKVLVLVSQSGGSKSNQNLANAITLRLMRGATSILEFVKFGNYTGATERLSGMSFSCNYLDSPNTTSAVTYKTQLANNNNGASVGVQEQDDYSTITLLEIGA
jgi:hypothetical protein